jgi:hypothetical protein
VVRRRSFFSASQLTHPPCRRVVPSAAFAWLSGLRYVSITEHALLAQVDDRLVAHCAVHVGPTCTARSVRAGKCKQRAVVLQRSPNWLPVRPCKFAWRKQVRKIQGTGEKIDRCPIDARSGSGQCPTDRQPAQGKNMSRNVAESAADNWIFRQAGSSAVCPRSRETSASSDCSDRFPDNTLTM